VVNYPNLFSLITFLFLYEIDSSAKGSAPHSNATKPNTRLSSSTDGILISTPSSLSPTAIRQHLSPNITTTTETCRHILQRSPSSTTPPVTPSSQVAAFRSQRGSISFDTQTPLINSPTTTVNKTKAPTTYSIFPTCITKPRLKFSMVRDTAMASLGHSAPVYSMPITRDYSIDEKTNRIVNEFLMHDPQLEGRKNANEDASYRGTPKRHHHRIRPKTFDELTPINNTQKQSPQPPSRSTLKNQRHQNSLQSNMRRHSQHQYASVQLPESIEQDEEDSSDPSSPLVTLNQPSVVTTRRENSIAAGSPSIIITGDDSGS
jgi:hypothetical protein